MTNVEKGMIRFFYSHQNIVLVAQIIGQLWTTIKSFLTCICQHQSLDNIPCPNHSVRLLRKYLFSVIYQMISFGMQLEDILFQQDNASVHKVYSLMDLFERNYIELVENPSYSPDLNHIEHV